MLIERLLKRLLWFACRILTWLLRRPRFCSMPMHSMKSEMLLRNERQSRKMNSDYGFLSSLSLSQLQSLLSLHPKTASSADPVRGDERIKQRELMARKRSAQRDISIPPPKDPARRLYAEQDPKTWLSTYFADQFSESWTADREAMLYSIIDAAKYGGDQAIAGPRGEGKTTIATRAALYLMVKGLSTFPVVIGKSQGKAQLELKDIKEQLQQNELFIADYPEIGIPMQAVGGWSSRARMQTVSGVSTNIELAADHLAFPTIERWQLPGWPEGIEPASSGQVFYCLGIDGPVRGTKFRSKRPTLAIIDDIEDREAAASDVLIEKNAEIINQDIAGLGASAERIPRAMLCTVQNRKCIAYKFTDPKQFPSWKGKRYRKMIRRPDRMDLVDQYIDLRKGRAESDPDARVAFAFWRDNRETIEAGCIVSNPHSYSKKQHSDGEPMELSSIQSYFNRVADVGEKAVATEIDNDPPEDAGPMGQGLTPEIVASRISGLARRQLPANTMALTAAIDLGKYRCHWVVTAWWPGGGGVVADYGVAEVVDTDTSMTSEGSEPAIYRALLNWRDELIQKRFVDATGTERKVDFCMVDSGNFTNAAYKFCSDVGGIFHPSKGWSPYRRKAANTANVIAGANLHASRQSAAGVWLYDLDTDYWKQFVHERFLTPTFDENNMLRRGSLSLYSLEGNQKHGSFAQHVAAEELVSEFKEGKGSKQYWRVQNDNNHWLDALYMAAAAGEVCGVKLIAPSEIEVEPRQVTERPKEPKQVQSRNQHGKRWTRPGGWIPKRR